MILKAGFLTLLAHAEFYQPLKRAVEHGSVLGLAPVDPLRVFQL
jgi:hypothetical protein